MGRFSRCNFRGNLLATLLVLLALLSLAFWSVSCKKEKNGGSGGSTAAQFKTDDERALYSMGIMFGGRLADLKLNEQELEFLVQGIRDAAQGKKPEVDIKQFQSKVRDLFSDRLKKNSEVNKKEGIEFLDKFVKSEGATKTPSGLAYKIITEGTGKVPAPTDVVEVHYKGTLINGTVFDSSYERNEKVSFPLNRVIKGWTEGLQLLKEGGKAKLVIPSDLAYGDHGAPPKIPGGATLLFEVELFKIINEKNAAPGGVGAAAGNGANAAAVPSAKSVPTTPAKTK
ncbi:MAG: FKBP-type peptidyl-prolyl cis-trans isomerase [Oligoflexia bacterium]|nr:FKBP-type peptidyl-prolyl cis-trans isomerase [Oligoflexia bacterium]